MDRGFIRELIACKLPVMWALQETPAVVICPTSRRCYLTGTTKQEEVSNHRICLVAASVWMHACVFMDQIPCGNTGSEAIVKSQRISEIWALNMRLCNAFSCGTWAVPMVSNILSGKCMRQWMTQKSEETVLSTILLTFSVGSVCASHFSFMGCHTRGQACFPHLTF